MTRWGYQNWLTLFRVPDNITLPHNKAGELNTKKGNPNRAEDPAGLVAAIWGFPNVARLDPSYSQIIPLVAGSTPATLIDSQKSSGCLPTWLILPRSIKLSADADQRISFLMQ